MDPHEITRLVEEMRLSVDADEPVFHLSGKERRPELQCMRNMVVGKIFDVRVVNRETLRVQLPRILQTRRELIMEIVGDNLFAVEFGLAEDRSRALYDGPWNFFRNLMLFKAPSGLQHPSEVIFDEYSSWIQLHNLPISYMRPAVIKKIAEMIGQVLEVDVNEGGNCLGQFARVRILRSVNEPLKRYVRILLDEGLEERLVLIRYEKLPDFCFACGRVSHVLRHSMDSQADKKRCVFGQ